MESTEAFFQFTDLSLGQALLESKPPDGLTVSEGGRFGDALVCSDASGAEVSIQVVISIKTAVIPLAVAVAWLVTQLKKRGHKQGRINNQDVRLEDPEIRRLIDDELRKEALRDAQWRAEHDDTKK